MIAFSARSGAFGRAFLRIALVAAVAAVGWALGCAAPPSSAEHQAAVSPSPQGSKNAQADSKAKAKPAGDALAAIPKERQTYYRKAFADAARFEVRKISAEMLSPIDAANNTFVVARDAAGKTLGYLRDFQGPVSAKEGCSCAPLMLTLALNAQGGFKTLLLAGPLTKWGHEPFSKQDTERLFAILAEPAKEIVGVAADDMVDGTSGATRSDLAAYVVPKAAMTTARILGLVNQTQQIVLGAPIAHDKAALQAILSAEPALPAGDVAEKLADLLPNLQSENAYGPVFQTMLQAYLAHATEGGAPLSKVLDALRAPKGPAVQQLSLRLLGVESLLEAKVALGWVEAVLPDIAKQLEKAKAARLWGSLAFVQGKMGKAAKHLAVARKAYAVHVAPQIHGRWLKARFAGDGNDKAACAALPGFLALHPKYPGMQAKLKACFPKQYAQQEQAIAATRKQKLLSTQFEPGLPAPTLDVTDLSGKSSQLNLGQGGKVQAVAFFATWCPHCQKEMPGLVAVSRWLAEHPKKPKASLLGIRTGIEREYEPYPVFAERYGIDFLVWTDTAMSLGLQSIAGQLGVEPGLPMIVVVDAQGKIRYLMRTGPYGDGAEELRWALASLF